MNDEPFDFDPDELISLTEASLLAQKNPATAWYWKKQYMDFPSPSGRRAGGKKQMHDGYKRIEIIAWLIRHDLIEPIDDIDPDDYLIEYEPPQKEVDKRSAFDNNMARKFITGQLQLDPALA